jgi:hypothetical protein
MDEDHRLARLYDYTKFHIGVYLASAGAMVTIAGSRDGAEFFKNLIESQNLLYASIIAMVVAGISGGVIASSCTMAHSFDQLWHAKTGPSLLRPLMTGERWAQLEHAAFWVSAILFVCAVFFKLG